MKILDQSLTHYPISEEANEFYFLQCMLCGAGSLEKWKSNILPLKKF